MKKQRIPRKLKKKGKTLVKEVKYAMDIARIPEGMTIKRWISLFDQGVIWYDSSKEDKFINL